MRRSRLLFALWILLCICFLPKKSFGQAVRFDSISSTTSAQCASGKICPLNAIPGTTVALCSPQTTYAACIAAPATTYTSASASQSCPQNSPLTPATGGSCLATSDNQGGFGFWTTPGSYTYFLVLPRTAGGGTYGPYPITIGGSQGCPLDATCDANYATLALACSAAGVGTLYVTKAWNGTPTQALACQLQFLGGGKIQPGSGQTVTLPGNTLCPAYQQCYDESLGTISFSQPPASLTPPNFGAPWNGTGDDTTAIGLGATAAMASGGVLTLPAGSSKIGCLTINVSTKLTIRGPGAGTAYGNNLNITTTCTTGPGFKLNITAVNPHIDIRGFQLTGPGNTSQDGLYIGGAGSATGIVEDVSATNYTGSTYACVHLSNAEEVRAVSLATYTCYNGLNLDGSSNNNAFFNYSGNLATNAALTISGSSNGNAFYAPLLQSSGYGCILNGDFGNKLDTPWFENNSTVAGCALTNESGWEFTNVHATEPSGPTYFMTLTANTYVAPGRFTAGIFSITEPGIDIASSLAAGNQWVGVPPGHFAGTGASPLREVLGSYVLDTHGGNLINGFTNAPLPISGSATQTCSSGTCNFDLTKASNFYVTVSGSFTVGLSDYLATSINGPYCFIFQVASGSISITWPSGMYGGGQFNGPGLYSQCFIGNTASGANFFSIGPMTGPMPEPGARSYLAFNDPVSQSGTSGTASCTQSLLGAIKISTCYLNAYQQTGAAQTYSFPVAYSTYPTLLEGGSGGNSCGSYNPSTTASTLTLPANAAMTAETCTITLMGQ